MVVSGIMAKACPITKKTSQMGGSYRNRTRATEFVPSGKSRRYPNLQKKKIFVPEINTTVSMEVSTRGIRTIKKLGAFQALKKAGIL